MLKFSEQRKHHYNSIAISSEILIAALSSLIEKSNLLKELLPHSRDDLLLFPNEHEEKSDEDDEDDGPPGDVPAEEEVEQLSSLSLVFRFIDKGLLLHIFEKLFSFFATSSSQQPISLDRGRGARLANFLLVLEFGLGGGAVGTLPSPFENFFCVVCTSISNIIKSAEAIIVARVIGFRNTVFRSTYPSPPFRS